MEARVLTTADTFKPFNSTEAPLAREAVSYWTSFARSYDPSTSKASGSPSWPAVGAGGNNGNGKRIVPMEGSANGTATTVENIDDGYVQRCLVRPDVSVSEVCFLWYVETAYAVKFWVRVAFNETHV
jgi:hypothetical protein